MRTLLLAAALFCLSTISLHAQSKAVQPVDIQPQPKTALETFQAKTGSVVVRGFSSIALLTGVGGTVEVEAREILDAQTGRKVSGLVIEVKGSGRYDRTERAFVDYDEIDSLLKGIDYISKIGRSVTKLESFEADYKTKGSLTVTAFNEGDTINFGVSCGLVPVSVFFKQAELPSLRKAISAAQTQLDIIK